MQRLEDMNPRFRKTNKNGSFYGQKCMSPLPPSGRKGTLYMYMNYCWLDWKLFALLKIAILSYHNLSYVELLALLRPEMKLSVIKHFPFILDYILFPNFI